MSNLINNREYRREVLKELITQLHSGKGVDEVKQKFEETFSGVSASEISEVEQALIMDGMPVSEVQRLCDVHAAVFKGSIEQIHSEKDLKDAKDPTNEPGHPIHTFKSENRAIEKLINERIKPHVISFAESNNAQSLSLLQQDIDLLSEIEIHYQKKENLLFPYLEKYGITAPPKVMWGVDDEIRALLKGVKTGLYNGEDRLTVKNRCEDAFGRITEMIFKEENILLPMMSDTLTQDEWKQIAEESKEMGYCLISNVPDYAPLASNVKGESKEVQSKANGALILPSGVLNLEEIVKIFDSLPFDITFVDKDDTVKYFSQGSDRIFPRTKAIIGRSVTNCHPPASVHIVQKIVQDFKSGAKDHEDFYIHMGARFVFIRYFAVRSDAGEYMGTLEVTQDIAPIQAIAGEKRLMS